MRGSMPRSVGNVKLAGSSVSMPRFSPSWARACKVIGCAPGLPPAGTRITIGTSLLAAASTSTTSDASWPASTASPGRPSADRRRRSGESDVLMICRRYVLDQSAGHFAAQHATIADHVHAQRIAHGQRGDEGDDQDQDQRAVDQHADAAGASGRSWSTGRPAWRARTYSGSVPARTASCPSPARRRRYRRRSRCTCIATLRGCRCRSDRPARTGCNRRSRPGAALWRPRERPPLGSPRRLS